MMFHNYLFNLKFIMRSEIKILLKVYKKDVIDHCSEGQISVLWQQ